MKLARVIVDFGNSQLKVALFIDGIIFKKLAFPINNYDDIWERLRNWEGNYQLSGIFIGSTAPSKSKVFQEKAKEVLINSNVKSFKKPEKANMKMATQMYKELGIDLYAVTNYLISRNMKHELVFILGSFMVTLVIKDGELKDVILASGFIHSLKKYDNTELIKEAIETNKDSETSQALQKGRNILLRGYINETLKEFEGEKIKKIIIAGEDSDLVDKKAISTKNIEIDKDLVLKAYHFLSQTNHRSNKMS